MPFDHSITGLQQRVGAYIWTELAIVSTLSRFIDTISDSSAVALVGSHAQVHAEHSELWHKRMPTLWDREVAGFIAPPNATTEKQFEALAQPNTKASTIELLDVLYSSLMTDLLHTYSTHLDAVDPRTDPATVDVLSQCIAHLTQHIAQAQIVIKALRN